MSMRSRSLTFLTISLLMLMLVDRAEAGWLLDRIRARQASGPKHLPTIPSQPTSHRAGHPEYVHNYAVESTDCDYAAGYVGGGSVLSFKGRDRLPNEGTWGMDYRGSYLKRRTFLRWFRQRTCQGGAGAYETDGPHVPDIVAPLGI